MGADFYIQPNFDEHHEKTEPIFKAAVKKRDDLQDNLSPYGKEVKALHKEKRKLEAERTKALTKAGADQGLAFMSAVLSKAPEGTRLAEIQQRLQVIEPIHNKSIAESQECQDAQTAVSAAFDAMYSDEFYFRDSYNATSIANILDFGTPEEHGLDDDNDPKDIVEIIMESFSIAKCGFFETIQEMCDENSIVDPLKCGLLAQQIKFAKLSLPTEEQLRAWGCSLEGEDSVEGWHEFFKQKKADAVAFWYRGAESENGVSCSC